MKFQDFLNQYSKDGKVTSKSIKKASADGISSDQLNEFVTKAEAGKKGSSLKGGVFEGTSGNILSGTSGSSSGSSSSSSSASQKSSDSDSVYSGGDIDLGAYEAMAGIDYQFQNLLQTDVLNSNELIANINADADKYIADAGAAASMYASDASVEIAGITSSAEERWRTYLADQERATAENVATIQGEYGLDLQEIITAGLKDVETIRGEYGIQAETLRGEYGLEAERIKGATDRDVAQRQKEAAIYGNMMQGFWS